jgi:DNA-binding transcriptional ArsR family regulator
MKTHLSPEIQELAQHQAALCRVFSSTQRILILWVLAEGESTVTEIARAIGASMQSTSQHLRLMELNHIVESRREHHNIYYRIVDSVLLRRCLVLAKRPNVVSQKREIFQT